LKINYGPYIRTLEQQIEFDNLVIALKAKTPKRPPTTTQAESTMRTLSRDPRDDFAWQNRPLPENWKAKPDAETLEAMVGEREVDLGLVSMEETRRRRPKNSDGQSEKSATTPERREKAIDAVIYTPPAKVTKEEVEAKAINLQEYKSTPI
jgi:hypothetical protein